MIPRIVFTGGPCGGKTTAVRHLQEELPKYGLTPIVVPEMATLLYGAGVRWTDMTTEKHQYEFQANVIQQQIALEDSLYSFANVVPGRKVFICDRGTIDNLAYAKDEWHEDILSQVGSIGFLKRRYDAVLHMETLAYGAGYSLDNAARYEDPQAARDMCTRTWNMWRRGPTLPHAVIRCHTSLADKLEEATQFVVRIIGCRAAEAPNCNSQQGL
jgi:hypothetical protein